MRAHAAPTHTPRAQRALIDTRTYIPSLVAGIFWHRDDAPNDGQNDHPVVSFCLGNSCTFGLCHQWSWQRGKEHGRSLTLHSGDCILFGGPCRYIHHAVTGVQRGTCPLNLKGVLGDARLNLTFRDAPQVNGLEKTTYKYFEPPGTGVKKRPRKKRPSSGKEEEAKKKKSKAVEVEEAVVPAVVPSQEL